MASWVVHVNLQHSGLGQADDLAGGRQIPRCDLGARLLDRDCYYLRRVVIVTDLQHNGLWTGTDSIGDNCVEVGAHLIFPPQPQRRPL